MKHGELPEDIPALRILEWQEITLDRLLRMNRRELLRIKGIGEAAAHHIKRYLDEHGFSHRLTCPCGDCVDFEGMTERDRIFRAVAEIMTRES